MEDITVPTSTKPTEIERAPLRPTLKRRRTFSPLDKSVNKRSSFIPISSLIHRTSLSLDAQYDRARVASHSQLDGAAQTTPEVDGFIDQNAHEPTAQLDTASAPSGKISALLTYQPLPPRDAQWGDFLPILGQDLRDYNLPNLTILPGPHDLDTMLNQTSSHPPAVDTPVRDPRSRPLQDPPLLMRPWLTLGQVATVDMRMWDSTSVRLYRQGQRDALMAVQHGVVGVGAQTYVSPVLINSARQPVFETPLYQASAGSSSQPSFRPQNAFIPHHVPRPGYPLTPPKTVTSASSSRTTQSDALRQTTSCYYCRSRKIKCDGQEPCSQCSRRGLGDCSYAEVRRRRGKAKRDADDGVPQGKKSDSPDSGGAQKNEE